MEYAVPMQLVCRQQLRSSASPHSLLRWGLAHRGEVPQNEKGGGTSYYCKVEEV